MTTRPYRIRAATDDDLPALVLLWKEFMDFHAERNSFFRRKPGGEEKWIEFVREHLAKDEQIVFVAEDGSSGEGDGNVIGYLMGGITPYPPVLLLERCGYIQDAVVSAANRRRGVGEALLADAERWFREKGIDRIELQVLVANPVAHSFWRKMDFGEFVEKLVKNI